ncbi:hypothetical protein ACFWGI_31295 [Streptomyces niveus]|uniref:hypothetical protein n=1 Tax=Streptomyces niveus TaxID=193462 RepID=UPI00364E5CC2
MPESVIGQLDDYVDLLGQGATHGKLTPEQVRAMARAVYELLRDTGRRPYEIAELRTDCLERTKCTTRRAGSIRGALFTATVFG